MTGIKIGKIFGFTIRVDFSWFIVFFLILWTFTIGVFPTSVPGLDHLTYFAMGISATLLFFASLLLHELSHSFVARAKGIPVDGITLFIFGGIAHTRAEAERPRDEFAIAGAGPLCSLALAALIGVLLYAAARAGLGPEFIVVLRQLMVLNVAIAVFNLLPGFPLDGGRLFRAVLWRATGDLTRATRIATAAGSILGLSLIGFGLWRAFTGSTVGGLWLVFVGWFLHNAAVSSYQQHVLQEVLGGARAEQIMTRTPETVPPTATLQQLMNDYFLRRRFTAYPVASNGTPLGVITLQQLREIPTQEWQSRSVGDTMTAVTRDNIVHPSDSVLRVLDGLKATPARRVLVLRGNDLVGIITPGDVTSWLERARLTET
jgi:Zn-dependent protease/CBS domain-containing protein